MLQFFLLLVELNEKLCYYVGKPAKCRQKTNLGSKNIYYLLYHGGSHKEQCIKKEANYSTYNIKLITLIKKDHKDKIQKLTGPAIAAVCNRGSSHCVFFVSEMNKNEH